MKSMQTLSHLILAILQWLLVVWGLLLILIALNNYAHEISYFSSRPTATALQTYYSPPTFQRMLTGVVTGLCSVGIGAILFYLRRIFLRQKD